MLDINRRVRCEGTTVAEMIEALQRLPQNGIVHFEGKKKGYIHCDPESGTINFDTDDLSATYEEVSEEPKEYYLVCIDTFFKELIAVKAQNQSEAEVKAEKLSQIDFNGLDKEVYSCATCDTHTKTYAQRHNYRIIEEDV
mgnify:FL=1